jgi:ubiquinone/menaquinone biosynthesis C-methylase UbiE
VVSRVYDRVAALYDDDWSGLYATARIHCINQIASHLDQLDSPLDTVDFGIGTGNALRELQQRVPLGDCTGFDISRGMLTQAAKKLNGEVKLIHDDAASADLYLSEESLDLALCHFLLSFVSAHRALDMAHSLLRPGGMLSLATSTQGSLSELHNIHYPRVSRLVGVQRSLRKANTPLNHRQCLELLETHGFEIVAEHLQRQPVCFESFADVRCWALDSGWAASFLDGPLGIRKLWGRLAFALAECLFHPFYPIEATNEISIVLARKPGPVDPL